MRQQLKKRYGLKGKYYQEFIEILDGNSIRYELLNFIIPDTEPGDLDIMINLENKSFVYRELTGLGFEFYTKFNSNQFLWNKFIQGVGFVQIHVYIGLSFWNYDFMKKVPNIENSIDRIHLSFLVYLIESMFRKNIKPSVFNSYKRSIVLKDFRRFCVGLDYRNIDFVDAAIKANQNVNYMSTMELLKFFNFPIRKYISYILFKLQAKFKRYLNNEDQLVIILGVDGAGKSTLVDAIYRMCSKGGIYPKTLYLGLRQSFIHRSILYLKGMRNNSDIALYTDKPNPHRATRIDPLITLYRFLKVVPLWIEYNLRLIKYVYLIPNSARTIYLVDRSYIDIVLYFHESWIVTLFSRFSISPSKIIYLNGNEQLLSERSGESSFMDVKRSNNIYLQFLSQCKNSDILILDTTKNSIEDCKYKSIQHILDGE